MPETSSPIAPSDEAMPSPSTVGNTFMRQYYHFLAKDPQSLHRFYKAESRWCHGLGSHMEEPIAGQRAINDQILKRGYAGARVDLDAGSIDCQNSLGGGVLVLVTGVMTLRSSPEPKPFVQTFFLAVQPKGYFVLNDCLRFLELSTLSNEEVEKEKSPVLEKTKKRETPVAASPVKKEPNEATAVVVSPQQVALPVKNAAKTTSTTKAKVEKEDTSVSPVKAPATVTLSPVKKTTSATTAKPNEETLADAAKTPSPVKSAVEDQIPAAAASPVPVAAPADPVVSPPAEPEKPKTWAALFSTSKPAATIPPPAAIASPAATPTKPATPKDAATPVSIPAPAVVSPTSGAPVVPEKSPKNKSSNDNEKEKEHKRFYSLFIRDLPPQTRENDLHELFKGYGSIAGVNVVLQRNFAFVDYYEEESMRAALAETKEFKVLNKVLQVSERGERGDRKEGQRGGFRGNDSRGRGRGPKSGRGDRKERNGDDAPLSSKGERREGLRREKTGNRRGGKVDATPRAE